MPWIKTVENHFSEDYRINKFSMEFMDADHEDTFRLWSRRRWWRLLRVNLIICAVLNGLFALIDWNNIGFTLDLFYLFFIRIFFSIGILGIIFLTRVIKKPVLSDYVILIGTAVYSLAISFYIYYSHSHPVNISILITVIIAYYLVIHEKYLHALAIGLGTSIVFTAVIFLNQMESSKYFLSVALSFSAANVIAILYVREMHYQRRKSFYEFIREIHGRLSQEEEIAKRLEAENKLRDLVNLDPLTNALNRRAFFEDAKKELSRTIRHSYDLSILIIDVDLFKKVNDTFGHSAGDKALCFLTETFKNNLRASDLFARVGGEEFCVLLPETRPEEAFKVGDKIRLIIEKNSGSIGFPFTISIGVAGYLGELNLDHLYVRADEALYQAKDKGRNRVELASGSL